jgi:hypothetical protein
MIFIIMADEYLQFVTVSQPINAVAFVADGLYCGVSDFAFAAYSTVQISILVIFHCIVVSSSCSILIT